MPPRRGALEVLVGARSDRGFRRRLNEDAWLAAHPVYLVADGMGGHDAGDRASAAVVAAFRPLAGRSDLTVDDVAAAVDAAHAAVDRISRGTTRGAGSTLAGIVALVQGGQPRWLVFSIGDSRVYRMWGGRLTQLTHDHSVVQEMIDQGELDPRDAASHSGRNVITRAVGDGGSAPDYWLREVVTGERFVLCSDGLSGELDDEALRIAAVGGGTPSHTAQSLIDRALARGGRDNITTIVLDVVSGGAGWEPDADAGFGPAGFDIDERTVEADTVTSGRRGGTGG
ncbi:protein phosphatase 2C domain-containing protein [uncultured Microbacterium sp.]|uniref:PP2C family protein-serine/threonine phosphatase n=1 Tax=uncultured Microbacterium sp. TaxID=191216 RepID=UPI0025F265A7|nr:protein phosphatase 2C domain-containing protein [uncultured Microbacterium sp.]